MSYLILIPRLLLLIGTAMGLGGPPLSARAQQVLAGHVPDVCSSLQPIGSLPGTNVMRLAIGLPLRNTEGLSNLLEQLYDPRNPNFRQYLTPEQFTQQFGPTEEDYQGVIAFAQAHNLSVTYAHSNRMILDVRGTVADIENALHVNMLLYQHPTEDRTFYAPDVDPSVDLAAPLLDIEGLDDYAVPKPNCMATTLGDAQTPTPDGGSGPNGKYWGYDFRKAYVPGVTLSGSGQAVGLLEFTGYYTSDIIAYETNAMPTNALVTLTNVLLDGFNTNEGVHYVEAALDIDMAISMAPGLSQVIVYEAPGSTYPHDLLNRMADDNLAKQLSCSWLLGGGGKTNLAGDPVGEQIFEQMAAQGQSMFVVSFDGDAWTASIKFACDSPHVTVVGGTTLTNGPDGSWVSEAVWNWNNAPGCGSTPDEGSGGGISTNYAIPAWQAGVSMASNQGSITMRNIPDVALTADNICIYSNGVTVCMYGTSCAAPLWAGFTALVNEQATANGGPPVGFLNPALYAIGESSSYTNLFHDITIGNNTNTSSPTKYFAVAGYDLCTGWGTPKGQGLINALAGSCLFTPVGALNTPRTDPTTTLLPNGLVLTAGGYGASGYLTNAELYYPSNGAWSNTGSFNSARTFHTATLLPNGLVLAAGGRGNSGALTNSDLYDPSSGTWTATGALNTARYNHTATLLPNGLVLVTGGLGSGSLELPSVELYNPSNGTWTATNSLSTPRAYHTATLLPNGLVLVAGGVHTNTDLRYAELYNPCNGTWTNTGSLNTGRAHHATTLLPDGLVLAAGGYGANGYLPSAELYYPATGAWSNTGTLNTARDYHTLTLLPNGFVLAAGGLDASGYAANAELYNLGTGTWTNTCSLNASRSDHTATMLPDGFVLIVGGDGSSGVLSNSELYPMGSAELIYTNTGAWTNTGSLKVAHDGHTATLLPNDSVLVAGGDLANGSAELYNPSAGAWAFTGYLNTGRYDHTATLLPNGLVLVNGGLASPNGGWPSGPDFNTSVLASAELYNPSNGAWTATGSLNTGRYDHTATLLPNGLVLAAGGQSSTNGGYLASAELYKPNGLWTTTGSLHTARTRHTATLLPNGRVLLAGGTGQNGVLLASSELYDPATTQWTTTTGSMSAARSGHTATLLPNGMVLVAGGCSSTNAELYNPSTEMWTNTGALSVARYYHTVTLLPVGIVLVAGGYDGTNYLPSAELYDPASGTWALAATLKTARAFQTATMLPNGLVLVAGGLGASGDLSSAELYNP